MAMVNAFAQNMVYTLAGGLVGEFVGIGIEAARTAEAPCAAAQATSKS